MKSGHVLVVNSGSSSVKYQVISHPDETVANRGVRERVGIPGGDFADHRAAISDIIEGLDAGVALDAVAHRVVHGGQALTKTVVIDDGVIRAIEKASVLAPLHNPANLQGIHAVMEVLPEVPQVAVFDTAFFSSLPPASYDYALPRHLVKRYGIRKYGFHGTSHDYVTAVLLEQIPDHTDPLRVVSFHLGNGSSVAAVRGGVAVDTSMGLTPLPGLVMGSRSGDIDPSIPLFLQREAKMTPEEVDVTLNRESGLLGLSGNSDMRDVLERAESGDADAEHAIEVWAWRAKHFLGAYMAQLGGLDAVIFTGGIGENQGSLRARIVQGLEGLGLQLDPTANSEPAKGVQRISSARSNISAWVIPTNEELHISRQAVNALGEMG